jgi:hypothetical protein
MRSKISGNFVPSRCITNDNNSCRIKKKLSPFFYDCAIQGVFEVEVFLLTCDSMRCSKEF